MSAIGRKLTGNDVEAPAWGVVLPLQPMGSIASRPSFRYHPVTC